MEDASVVSSGVSFGGWDGSRSSIGAGSSDELFRFIAGMDDLPETGKGEPPTISFQFQALLNQLFVRYHA